MKNERDSSYLLSGTPEFEAYTYNRMEAELYYLVGKTNEDPRQSFLTRSRSEKSDKIIYSKFDTDSWLREIFDHHEFGHIPGEVGYRQNIKTTEQILHTLLSERLYSRPGIIPNPKISLIINRNAKQNSAYIGINTRTGQGLVDVQMNNSAPLTIMQEELLHGGLYVTSGYCRNPEANEVFENQVAQATHASILMDRILTAAAGAMGNAEYEYWLEKAQQKKASDANKYIRCGRGSIMGFDMNTRFLDPIVDYENIGRNLINLEVYVKNITGYDNDSEKRRFLFELMCMGFGKYHKDWMYGMIDRIDTSDRDIERVGRQIVSEWGIPMINRYKGSPQESEMLSHHAALSEPLDKRDFMFEVPDQVIDDANRNGSYNPSFLSSFNFSDMVLRNLSLSRVRAIMEAFSLSPSYERNYQLAQALEKAGITPREFELMQQAAQAEHYKEMYAQDIEQLGKLKSFDLPNQFKRLIGPLK